MHTRSKLALAGLAATLLMAFAVNSASANHLSVSSQNFRLVWTALTFFGEGTGSTENTIICPVTLEGSFHSSTLAKVIGALIGHVTRATVVGTSCTGGRATILQETLPWHVTYEGFSGTLPRITAVRLLLRNTAFVLEANGGLGTTCLYKENGTSAAGEVLVESGGAATALRADERIRLPLFRSGGIGGFLCPSEGGFQGSASVTVQGSSTRITIRLI